MKAAAAAKTGRQRAAIHSRTGNSSAIGTTVVQGCGGRAMTMTLKTMSNASAARPSMVSLRGGGSRAAEASPITRGAIVTMPSASDANQSRQVERIEAVSAMQHGKPEGAADPGDGGGDDRCRQQAQHMAQPVETER